MGADLTPLYVLNYGLVQRVTQRADGGWDVRPLELAFRTDLESGFNPVGPSDVRFSRENVPAVPAELGGLKLKFESTPARPFVIGDTVYYPLRNRSVVTTPRAADRVVNDISMLTGLAALDADGRPYRRPLNSIGSEPARRTARSSSTTRRTISQCAADRSTSERSTCLPRSRERGTAAGLWPA